MKSILPSQIPYSFQNFQEFCDWYLTRGPYFCVLEKLKTIQIAPNSSQTIVFQHHNYQVELYHIAFTIPHHSHPSVSTCEMPLIPQTVIDPQNTKILNRGGSHGGVSVYSGNPYYLFVLQEWKKDVYPDHISLFDYVGAPISPNHVDLIKAHNPSALDPSGSWIDTTRPPL